MSSTSFVYADEVFGIPKIADAQLREHSRFPVWGPLGGAYADAVPDIDLGHVFDKSHLHVLQIWANGDEQNILLQGDTGTGKTSLIKQMAARLNWPVFRVPCHGGMEFQELVGRVTLQPDGSTGWADGMLVAAMRHGGILLLDEINFLKPEAAGALNSVLEENAVFVPETCEIVRAHPKFRIAATGNAIDGVGKSAYRGTQTPNIALLARFLLGIRVQYMSAADEAKMLQGRFPNLHTKVATYLTEIADMSRSSYAAGTMKAPMSPRETIAVSKRTVTFSGSSKGDAQLQMQCAALPRCMDMTFLYRWAIEERQSFETASKQVAQRLGLKVDLKGSTNTVSANSSSQAA